MILEMVVAVSNEVVEVQRLQEEGSIAKWIARGASKYGPATVYVVPVGRLVFHFWHEERRLAEILLMQPLGRGQIADTFLLMIGKYAVKAPDSEKRFSSTQLQKRLLCSVEPA